MKLANFTLTRIIGRFPGPVSYLAEVDVTTGCLFWKKTERRPILRPEMSSHWRFADTGEFTPRDDAECLEFVWCGMRGVTLSALAKSLTKL